MGGCSSLTSLFIEDFMLQHREVEKQGRSRLHERKHRIFTLYLLDFVICHVFIGRSVSLSAHTGVPWPGPCVVAYWRGVWLLEHSVCVGPLHGPANILWAGLGLAVTAAIDTWHHQVQTQSRISVHCIHVSCSVRVWRPAAARARRVTPWRDTCTPWCGPGRTSRCGKVEQRHVSRVTCHVSPVTCHQSRVQGCGTATITTRAGAWLSPAPRWGRGCCCSPPRAQCAQPSEPR